MCAAIREPEQQMLAEDPMGFSEGVLLCVCMYYVWELVALL